MYVAIDSSHQLCYTGVISGSNDAVNKLYAELETIFKENGVAGKYHWYKLSRNAKQKLSAPLVNALRNSEVNFNMIYHRKPQGIQKTVWFLRYLPRQIAQQLERWLEGKRGVLEIIVDDDYNVCAGGRGTFHFIESLLNQINRRLTGDEASIRYEDKLKVALRQVNGNVLHIYASVGNSNEKGVQLADIFLGAYISERERFAGLKNVYYNEMK